MHKFSFIYYMLTSTHLSNPKPYQGIEHYYISESLLRFPSTQSPSPTPETTAVLMFFIIAQLYLFLNFLKMKVYFMYSFV